MTSRPLTAAVLLVAACAEPTAAPLPEAPAAAEARPSAEATQPAATLIGEVPSSPVYEAPLQPPETITLGDGVAVTPLYHGTVLIVHGDQRLWIDPWTKGRLTGQPTATAVLITDIHHDHLDSVALDAVGAQGRPLVAPQAVATALADTNSEHKVTVVLGNGQSTNLGGIVVTAIPMYNHTRGPEPGKLFHPKGRGNGYVVAVGGVRIYVAGDTACTSEMKALTGIDLALVPMNLPYTMPPAEAAECVLAFKPKMVTPYHYAGSDLADFTAAIPADAGVTVRLVDAYPGSLPF